MNSWCLSGVSNPAQTPLLSPIRPKPKAWSQYPGGLDGRVGGLTLIRRREVLPESRPEVRVDFLTLQKKGILVTKNFWTEKDGAQFLFAPGSIIGDRYWEFVERVEKNVKLEWKSKRNITEFSEAIANVTLQNNREVNIDTSDSLWLESQIFQEVNGVKLTVINALFEREALQLSAGFLFKEGQDLRLAVVDLANQSDLVKTEFEIVYKVAKEDGEYVIGYQGKIPQELVEYRQNNFTLKLGKLPIAPELLVANSKVDIQLIAIRSFASYSATQNLHITRTINR
jgi:hypothetical protein